MATCLGGCGCALNPISLVDADSPTLPVEIPAGMELIVDVGGAIDDAGCVVGSRFAANAGAGADAGVLLPYPKPNLTLAIVVFAGEVNYGVFFLLDDVPFIYHVYQ